jgi:hypothetical protein
MINKFKEHYKNMMKGIKDNPLEAYVHEGVSELTITRELKADGWTDSQIRELMIEAKKAKEMENK